MKFGELLEYPFSLLHVRRVVELNLTAGTCDFVYKQFGLFARLPILHSFIFCFCKSNEIFQRLYVLVGHVTDADDGLIELHKFRITEWISTCSHQFNDSFVNSIIGAKWFLLVDRCQHNTVRPSCKLLETKPKWEAFNFSMERLQSLQSCVAERPGGRNLLGCVTIVQHRIETPAPDSRSGASFLAAFKLFVS